MKTSCALALASVLALAGSALAMPAPTVDQPDYFGSGCEPGSVDGAVLPSGQNQFTYELNYAQLIAATAGQAQDRKDCDVAVTVRPPRGYRMRIAFELLQGVHDTPEAGTTHIEGDYSLGEADGGERYELAFAIDPLRGVTGNKLQAAASGLNQTQGNFQVRLTPLQWEGDNPWMWSDCNDDGNLALSLKSHLSLQAFRGSRGQDSDIELDRQAQGLSMGWGWAFEPCGATSPTSGFEGQWDSSYADASGHLVRALITVSGDRGTFQTAQWTGQLFGIQVQGNQVRGQWSALGQSGWFTFYLQPGAAFSGQWGYQGRVATGNWSGRQRH